MPTFLSDPPQAVYLILALGIVVTGGIWFNRRNRKSLTVFGGFVVLTAILFLIDRMFESPREESVRRVQAMAKAADKQDTEAFLSHVADNIQYWGSSETPVTISRDTLRTAGFWGVLKQYKPHVAVWDFSRADVREVDANTIEIGFLAKGEVQDKQVPIYLRATFTRQPDGQMKLTGLASFDPLKRTNERQALPLFP